MARGAMACVLLAALTAASAEAIDCTKAATAVEKAICASPELLQLDKELNGAFRQVREALPEGARASLRDEQRSWIAARDRRCGGGADCLALAMRTRIAELAAKGSGRRESVVATVAAMDGSAVRAEIVRVQQKQVGYEWDISYPRLSGLANPDVQKALNAQLAATPYPVEWPASDGEMKPEEEDWCSEGSHVRDAKITRLDARVLSLGFSDVLSCINLAHDSRAFGGATFELSSGEELSLEEVLRPGTNRARVRELVRRRLWAEMRPDCQDVWADDWDFGFWLTPGGMVIEPYFAHGVQACAESVELSPADLGDLANPRGPLAR